MKGRKRRELKLARAEAARLDFPYVRADAACYGVTLLQFSPIHYRFHWREELPVYWQYDFWPTTFKTWPDLLVPSQPKLCDVLNAIIAKHSLARKDAAINGAVGVPSLKKASLPETSDRVNGEEVPGALAEPF